MIRCCASKTLRSGVASRRFLSASHSELFPRLARRTELGFLVWCAHYGRRRVLAPPHFVYNAPDLDSSLRQVPTTTSSGVVSLACYPP